MAVVAAVGVVLAAVVVLAERAGDSSRATSQQTASPVPIERPPSETTAPPVAPPSSSAPATTAPPETAPAPSTDDGCRPVSAVSAWPLRRRLAALVVVGVDPAGTTEATAAVEGHHVGGLFVGGDSTGLLTSGALERLRAGSATGLVVAVDEEGGRVQRMEGLDGETPSARRMAATMTLEEVGALARRRARVMRDHGVTTDLAPVVDVTDQPADSVIGDRSWSDEPVRVIAYAGAYAEGLLAEGVTPVLKHFPGHGSASGDTHSGAATTPALDALRATDLVPYRELLPRLGPRAAVMLGHLDVPGLTEPGTPSSLSPATVRLLRDELGFDGVVMTDDLSAMAAVTARFDVAEAATRALAAGVDVVLLSGGDVGAVLDHLEAAVADGDLAEATVDAAVARTLVLKGVDACDVRL